MSDSTTTAPGKGKPQTPAEKRREQLTAKRQERAANAPAPSAQVGGGGGAPQAEQPRAGGGGGAPQAEQTDRITGELLVNGKRFAVTLAGKEGGGITVPAYLDSKQLLLSLLAVCYELANADPAEAAAALKEVCGHLGAEVGDGFVAQVTEALKSGADDVAATTTTGDDYEDEDDSQEGK